MIRSIPAALFAACALASCANSVGDASDPAPLAGTQWQLVRFQGGDDTVLTAADRSHYTLAFEADGKLAARIACNRGHGTWTSAGPSQLEFGPLALTRALCPPDPLQDLLVRHWTFVRSYVLRDGQLFLSLFADGGIYEFEPMPEQRPGDS